MTQEDKELLLKDLCARLPYEVKVALEYSTGKYTRIYDLREIDNDTTSESRQQVTVWNYGFYSTVISYPLICCRPYLRPMSSMTEEEKEEYRKVCELDTEILANHPMNGEPFPALYNSQDWLNKNMFDYRGLIPKNSAIEVTEENNPYKD